MALEVALYEPLVPGNTGNIGRLCTGFRVHLHLIEPLGFEISDRSLKRAGLDYWPHLHWSRHKNFPTFYEKVLRSAVPNRKSRQIVCFTKSAPTELQHVRFSADAVLLFGKETTGVPKEIIGAYDMLPVRIPIRGRIRAYNLANSVAMGLFEALRQTQWANQGGA